MSVDTAIATNTNTNTATVTTTTTTIDKATLKALIIQLFKEDKDFLREIVDLVEAEKEPKFDKSPLDMNDEEHAEFMKHIRKKHRGLTKETIEELQELWKDELPAEELVKMI